nr:hypothetical protein [Tanacetum cinerariifolium]
MLPVELTNKDIRNSPAYKEYYTIALGAAPPKTKASVRKTQSNEGTGIIPGVLDVPTDESDKEILWKSGDKDDDDDDVDDQSDADDDDDQEDEDDPDAGIDSLFKLTPRVDVPVMTTVVPLLVTAPTLPPPSIPIMS